MQVTNIFKYIILGVIAIIVMFAVIDIKKSGSEYNTEKTKYYEREIRGRLVSKGNNRGIRIRIAINGDVKNEYLYGSKNFDLSPSDLFDFLKINDSIVKPPNSLELYIYRGNEKYYFKLGEYINK